MFNSKSVIYYLFTVTVFLLYYCSESTEPDTTANDLIPLKIGNSWNYKFTDYDSSGTILYTENQTSTIVKDTSMLNYTWYSNNDFVNSFWYTNKADGYWAFVKENTGPIKKDTSLLIYKYPTQVGDIYGDTNNPKEVMSVDEEIIVPAGKFRVIHIINNYLNSNNYLLDSFEIYIAPHIGVIKTMQIGKKSDGNKFVVYKSELESYSLK